MKKRNYWAVGANFSGEDVSLEFIKREIWYDGYAANDNEKNKSTLEKVEVGDVLVLKSSATKGQGHSITFTKLKAVGEIIEKENYYTFKVKWLNISELPKDFDGISYRNTIEIMRDDEMLKFVQSEIKKRSEMEKIKEIAELLKANKNLILTGAPGTGKTYLAKQIAEAMNAEICFTQFHPSYDYTDFVEGLRPVQSKKDGNIDFELKNGIFKTFCKRALDNILLTKEDEKIKTLPQNEQNERLAFETKLINAYNSLCDDIENGKNTLPLNNGNNSKFLSINDNGTIEWFHKTTNSSFSEMKVKRNAKSFFFDLYSQKNNFKPNRKFLGGGDTSTTWAILNELFKKVRESSSAENFNIEQEINNEKSYVFIIDEINRGEISKIFGELFFSIDPDYRGIDGKVKTQYANIQTEETLFADDLEEGDFYIPENVYIIGTMNDIDRSVESFDFAMRRRFTWKEITAEQSAENMNLSEECKNRMAKLNAAISQIDGLNSSYHIGAAYFLKLKNYNDDYQKLWDLHLFPLLFEYLRGTSNTDDNLKKLQSAYLNSSNLDENNGQ